MAKGRVTTRDELLAFIRDSATPVGKREIARAYNLKGDQRIELKELLRDLRDSGEIAADRAKTFKDPKALTDITVLEIVRVDDDGHLLAVPRRHDEEQDGPPPRIEIVPQSSRGAPAPAVGDRVLASLKRRGKNAYEARIIRRLGSGPKKILGLYEEPDGRHGLGLVTPTDKKLRREFDVRAAASGNSTGMSLAAIEIRLMVRGSLIGPIRSITLARRESWSPVSSIHTMSPGRAPFLSAARTSNSRRSFLSVGVTRPRPWRPSGSS